VICVVVVKSVCHWIRAGHTNSISRQQFGSAGLNKHFSVKILTSPNDVHTLVLVNASYHSLISWSS
jgi:hypothetical protein